MGPWGRVAATVALVAALDQGTKALVRDGIARGASDGVLPGVELVHVRNPGVAFGALAGGGALVVVLTLAALAILLVFFARRPGRPLVWLPTGLLLGGAVGNLVDRARDGAVTDWIKLPHWPAFNVADMAITFGVLARLWVLEGPRRDKT
jgi:signal peptidase II